MSTIVLAHGLFGFGDLIPGFSLVNYFNGVRQELERNGHTVIVTTVNPIGSIKQRGAQLAKAILQDPKAVEGMHILGTAWAGWTRDRHSPIAIWPARSPRWSQLELRTGGPK